MYKCHRSWVGDSTLLPLSLTSSRIIMNSDYSIEIHLGYCYAFFVRTITFNPTLLGEKEFVMRINPQKVYDLLIIGAGGAGLAAAVEAKQQGVHPIIIEKMPSVRGNTGSASAGMNASETRFQKAQNIHDSTESFYQETFIAGKEANDPTLLHYLVDHSAEAIEWLDSLGIRLNRLTQVGGMNTPRTHRPEDGSPVGAAIMNGLLKQIKQLEIPIFTLTEALEFVMEDERLLGINVFNEAQEAEMMIQAKAAIVTTGGFGTNKGMIAQYNPDLKDFITTNQPGTVGDGIRMLQLIDGKTRDLEAIQIHPTVHQESGFLITEAVRGEGAILINHHGKRFVNEMDTRDRVSAAIMHLPEKSAYLLLDEEVKKRVPAIQFYESKGFVFKGETLRELAQNISIPQETLQDTVISWNTAVKNKEDNTYHRQTAMERPLLQAPFYAIPVAPGIHHTMGGVCINTRTEVLNQQEKVIEGIYAAGEVVGGIHGKNRIAGNAIAEIIVFGRQAGKQAAKYVAKN